MRQLSPSQGPGAERGSFRRVPLPRYPAECTKFQEEERDEFVRKRSRESCLCSAAARDDRGKGHAAAI